MFYPLLRHKIPILLLECRLPIEQFYVSDSVRIFIIIINQSINLVMSYWQ